MPIRSHNACWDAEHTGYEHRSQGQLDRRRQPLSDFLQDWAVGSDRASQIKAQHALQIAQILHGDRFIQSHALTDTRDGFRCGAFPQHDLGGIGRNEAQHGKDNDRDAQQNRHEKQHPTNDVSGH